MLSSSDYLIAEGVALNLDVCLVSIICKKNSNLPRQYNRYMLLPLGSRVESALNFLIEAIKHTLLIASSPLEMFDASLLIVLTLDPANPYQSKMQYRWLV